DLRGSGSGAPQARPWRGAPAGNIYPCPRRQARVSALVRLYDIQSVAVEKERVVAEQFVQFRNQRMVIGDYLGFELGQSLFDLRGIQFHNPLHSLAFVGRLTSWWSKGSSPFLRSDSNS